MKIKAYIQKMLSIVLGSIFVFMTVLALYQIITRYVFKSPSTFSEDVLSYSFVWISLIGATLLFAEKGHMDIDFVYQKLGKSIQSKLDIFINAIVILISISVFLYGGFKLIEVGAMQMSPTLNIPLSYVYSIFPITGVLLIIICICNVIEIIKPNLAKG